MAARPPLPAALRRLAGWTKTAAADAGGRVALGAAGPDGVLGGGIVRAALHEIHAERTADIATAAGFAVALALRAAHPSTPDAGARRPILWVRQDFLDVETGGIHPPGLAELGLDPGRVLLVRARDAGGVLRAAAEGARCTALAAVLIQPWGAPRTLDLTATRRLSLAAATSGVPVLLLRAAAEPAPSAAATRWTVRAEPSRALDANAPGYPVFEVRLVRHRGGVAEQQWRLEWDRDRGCFHDRTGLDRSGHAGLAPLSRPVVPLPADRSGSPRGGEAAGFRRAG
ncbi:hypothetical protein STVA_22520 [Allostella vacuolata]|nr:hypothetical protein STVA_22520 [Stella vacuolata]